MEPISTGVNANLEEIMAAAKSKEPVKRIQIEVPESVRSELKLECLRQGITMSSLLTDFIDTWLEQQRQKK